MSTGSAPIAPDQLSIEQVSIAATAGRIGEGRHERALRASAGRADHIRADPVVFAAALSIAASLARALDVAEAKQDTATATQSAKSYADLLDRLGLLPALDRDAPPVPAAGGADGDVDPMGEFGRPALVHTAV